MHAVVPPDEGSYSYAGIGYANPHAVTQIANGLSTTTYSYDQNGNLTQKATDGLTTKYQWDYANRLIALGSGGATTTYGYDAFGARVFQSTATTTTLYPFKWYSVASSTGSGAKYATTTEYVFNGDTLVSTIDQQFASGVATGTAQTRYIHPDHLGSTNVVTDASGTVVQTLDYYPYGSPRIKSGTDVSQREYIGQIYDEVSNLSYLNARYYDGARGQFLSEDPTFWALPSNVLADPQQMNSYNYARSNPIRFSDPEGKSIEDFRGPYGSPPYQTGDLFGSYQGVNIYNNGGNPDSAFQCTQFVDRFMAANWGVDASNFQGNGKDYLAPNLNAQLGSGTDFVSSYNRQVGNTLPTEDSIISFGPSAKSPYGHVAVVGAVNFNEETNSGYIVLASQNTSKFNPKITVMRNANGAYQVANYSGMRALGWSTPASRTSSGGGTQ